MNEKSLDEIESMEDLKAIIDFEYDRLRKTSYQDYTKLAVFRGFLQRCAGFTEEEVEWLSQMPEVINADS